MIQNFLFIMQCLWILFIGGIKYVIYADKMNSFIYVITQLGNINIFFLKMFQSLSTNTNLLTSQQMDFLIQYTDDVPFFNNEMNLSFTEDMQKVAEQTESSLLVKNILLPIKSGIIALIYEGTLDGKKIIIKVMRQRIKNKISDALDKTSFLFKILGYLPPFYSLNMINLIEENRMSLLDQTDFTKEVANIQRMQMNCKNTDYVIIPKVYTEYTKYNNNIIVMEYLDGKRLEMVDNNDKDEYSLLLAKFGMKCFLFNRFYHADLHAGNILFMKDINEHKQLGIIDYGLMGELTRDEQTFFYNFITAISADTKDYLVVSKMIMETLVEPRNKSKNMDFLSQMNNSTKTKLYSSLEEIISKALLWKRNITSQDMYEINKLLYRYDLQLARTFCKIALAFAISDSVCEELSHNKTYLENIKLAIESIFDMDMITC